MKNSTATRTRSLSLNTNFIDSEPVRRLVEQGKANALVTFLALQTAIRKAGYCVAVDDALLDGIGLMTGRDADSLRADIQAIIDAGFFDAGMYSAHNVLTTRRLQAAYRRRKDAQPIPEELQLKARRSSSRRRSAAKPALEIGTTAESADAEAVVAPAEAAEADSGERRMSRSARRRARRRAARLARRVGEFVERM